MTTSDCAKRQQVKVGTKSETYGRPTIGGRDLALMTPYVLNIASTDPS